MAPVDPTRHPLANPADSRNEGKDMMHAKIRSRALPGVLVFAALAACDGSSRVGEVGDSTRLELQNVELGRLVDVYAYQRINPADGDRRNRFNRRLRRVAESIVISPGIESEPLFDAAGEVVATADYEFRPFDKSVGHEELVILWDNENEVERANFTAALAGAQRGLIPLAAAYRGQNTQSRPIPIVPRNAAIRLQFSGKVLVNQAFFSENPSAIQLLEFKGDPAVVAPVDAFRILPYRVITKENEIILDTTILGGEGVAGANTAGLPVSADSVTANIRVAIPSRGQVVPTFYVNEDSVVRLNDVDSGGRSAVIRDFRSGNLSDGVAGRLREGEAPMIVSPLSMGIRSVDSTNNIITLNKRFQFVPIRGRYPFVDGPLDGSTRIPKGPLAAPIGTPLRHGDVLTQTIPVEVSQGVFELRTLRAEILENLSIGTVVGDPALPRLGLAENVPSGSEQGEELPEVSVRVSSAFEVDANGVRQTFRASGLPLGQDCLLRAFYYENIPFSSSPFAVSDHDCRHLFVRIDPNPAGAGVQPNASVAIEFTKPMDLDQVDNTANLLVTNTHIAVESFDTQMSDPKRATIRIVPTRLSDLAGDGTVLRLQPPMGFFHRTNTAETYCVHVRLGNLGVTDLAGNPLAIFDRPSSPEVSWSVDFSIDPLALTNDVAWHTYSLDSEDADGSLPGSVDMFGQFRLESGRLIAASGVRFGRSADSQNLVNISRINRGECWDPVGDVQLFPTLPAPNPPGGVVPTAPGAGVHPGRLYWQPRMSDTVLPPAVPQVFEYWNLLGQPVGRVVEPHKPQGSRMQMRYLEDDFSLSYRQPSEFAIDIEQLYWSPFNDETVLYDVFDRYTMSLAHSRRRQDERWTLASTAGPPPAGPFCRLDCDSMNSSLSLVFSENLLEGTSLVPVFEDKIYRINPNEAFRSTEGIKYVPFPRFDRTYTWRDSRLVTVDASGQVIGLGGAQQPDAQPPSSDSTARIDSPWVTDIPDPEFPGATWVEDDADFVGTQQRDHDPIALPLLVDFKVFADGAANSIAGGNNGFQVAMLGAPSNFIAGIPNGYYDRRGSGCGGGYPPWPRLRVHASGGEDIVTGANNLIDPANQLIAQESFVKDAGLGNVTRALFPAPPGDGMLNWARADFVRKVSTVTFGFFDTLNPQRFRLASNTTPVTVNVGDGFPDLDSVTGDLRISDLVVQMDPPQARQPAGTSVVVEIRGAEDFDKANTLYNPVFAGAGEVPSDRAADVPGPPLLLGRGNLLNANYACEAYRYSTANAPDAPRVAASGLTRYVTEDQLNLIRLPGSDLLPRYMNLRLVMTNNVDVTPALSPSLRSMSVVYRVQSNQ